MSVNLMGSLGRSLARVRVERLGHGDKRGTALRAEPVVAAEQDVGHTLPEVSGEQSVEERVDPRIQVQHEVRQNCQDGGSRTGTIILLRPVLPELARVKRQVAEGEAQDDGHQEADNFSPRPQRRRR